MSLNLSIGPEGDQWHYDPDSKSYDLSRGAPVKLQIKTTHGKEVESISLDASKTVLVIVDMQNFFLHPYCRDNKLGLATVAPLLKVIDNCRELNLQILWLNWGLSETDLAAMPAITLRNLPRSLHVGATGMASYGTELGNGQGRVLMHGAWNTEIYDDLQPAVEAQDIHCAKNRLSGMWNEDQPLRKYLTESGKRTLLFAGVNTDRCVLGTMADAAYAGWDCVVIEDCCATASEQAHDVCVANIELLHGFVISSETLCSSKILKE